MEKTIDANEIQYKTIPNYKAKSLHILENISNRCNANKVKYKFSKNTFDISDKYRKGRISASNWADEMVYMYSQKEKNFLKEFKDHLKNQKDSITILEDNDYKKGLLDQLEEIEAMLKMY